MYHNNDPFQQGNRFHLPKVHVAGYSKLRRHPYLLWLRMESRDMVDGCMVYTERAETATVSRDTNHVTSKQPCTYIISVDVEKRVVKSSSLIQNYMRQ